MQMCLLVCLHLELVPTEIKGLCPVLNKNKNKIKVLRYSCTHLRHCVCLKWRGSRQQGVGSIPLRLSPLLKSCYLWTLPCEFVPHN